jgi:hypothetical protein
MADGVSTNRAGEWPTLIQWSANTFADFLPEFNTTNDKILTLGDYGFNDFPGSSSSNVNYIALIDGIHSSMNGRYYRLEWDGILPFPIGVWGIRNNTIEFYVDPVSGGEVQVTVEPNFTNTGWNQTVIDDIAMPFSCTYTPGGFSEGAIHFDWLRGVRNWAFAPGTITWDAYDILQKVPRLKGDLVNYNFSIWACKKQHVATSLNFPSTGTPGNEFWARLDNSV